MQVNNKCVYRHRRLDSHEVFYVGIGIARRPYQTYDRSVYWKRIVNKAGYQVEILAENLSWEDACDLEKLLIVEYGRKDLGTGCLVNMTDGGDGRINSIINNETRKKLSIHSKNIKRTKEWCDRISASLTGGKLSKEHKLKLSKAKKGRVSNSSIKVKNIVTGEIFNSIKKAAESINMKHSTLVAKLSGQNPNNTNFQSINIRDLKKYSTKNTKKIVNTNTGDVYNSLREAILTSPFKYTTLKAMLNGQNKNISDFKYLNNDIE